jgi:hypothetical protein
VPNVLEDQTNLICFIADEAGRIILVCSSAMKPEKLFGSNTSRARLKLMQRQKRVADPATLST